MYTRTAHQSAFDGVRVIWRVFEDTRHGVVCVRRNSSMDGVIPCKTLPQQKTNHIRHSRIEQIEMASMLPLIRNACCLPSRVVSE